MARQLALWAAVLLAIGLVAAAVAPPQRVQTAPVFPAPGTGAAPAAPAVEGKLPATAPLVAEVGSVVRLRVGSQDADQVVVEGLGVRAPVGPGTTGVVEFVADSPGNWPVRLDPSGVRIGTVEVQG
jgi:hypothetical protein